MTTPHRWIALLTGVGLMLVAPASAEVSAWLRVSRAAPDQPFDADEFQVLKATVVQLASTRTVLDNALSVEGMAVVSDQADPAAWLFARLHVRTLPESELVEFRFDGDGQEAAKLLDAVVAAVIAHANGQSQAPAVIDALRAEEKQASANSLQSHEQYAALSTALGALDGETAQIRRKLLFDQLSGHQRALLDAQQNIAKFDSLLAETARMRKAAEGRPVSEAELESALRRHPEIASKYAVRDSLALELSHMGSTLISPDKNALYREKQLQAQQSEDDLRAAQDQYRGEVESELRTQAQAFFNWHQETLAASIQSYRHIAEQSAEEADKLRREIRRLEQASPELESLAAASKRESVLADESRLRLAERDAMNTPPPRVTLLQPAAPALPRHE